MRRRRWGGRAGAHPPQGEGGDLTSPVLKTTKEATTSGAMIVHPPAPGDGWVGT